MRGKTAPTITRLPTNVIGTRAPRRRFYRTDSVFESIFTHAALRYRAPGDASPRSPAGRRDLLIVLYSRQLHHKTHDLVRNVMSFRTSLRMHPFRHVKGASGPSGRLPAARIHAVFTRRCPARTRLAVTAPPG
ncbi:hypothetical protein A8E97_21045 [Burkholderia cenocepacia]|nr:hypothetical protein A8E88_19920 [Burkholderia cenocepacia]ONV84498.1 hypothetical protein A8E89_25820 [Burkholderia cenocepacia]ONW14058.1 hypothetical protein A8E94_15135 [Burkholderia cenocepacia]ONW18079.1 hypothetical protein A8E90_14545 [Burkholderia cenocepacia]ONW28767.1 hypothetical protein A8E93_34720 [Burkholderia cenocepacia]